MEQPSKKGLQIGTKSFFAAILVICLLMAATYLLTHIVPAGEYPRILDENGNTVIDTEGGFTYVEGGISFGKWLLSPILVLGSAGSDSLIAVIAFLLVIGGIFNALDRCGLIRYMLERLSQRFGTKRYRLLAVILLFFMTLGAAIGSFEECVPLVPLVVALAIHLGWDTFTGIGMSLLAVGCGFASGVCNPFTVGVAQQLAGLPMFSGIWIRLLSFLLIYLLLAAFVILHAKKVERPIADELRADTPTTDPHMNRGLVSFVLLLGIGLVTILCSGFLPVLQDYTMVIVAIMFLVAGIVSTLLCGMGGSALAKAFGRGVVSILPAILMILMASSISYTMEEAKILDTLLYSIMNLIGVLPRWSVILCIYFMVLIANFFIPSGSAKAFMMIPLLVPIADMLGISIQLCIVAFAFGDGFSNVFYPTNPALLISLGLANTGYPSWFKWSYKFQLLNLLLTAGILLLGLAVGY